MADVIASVIAVLRSAGYRAGDANPGGILPEITEPVLAVNLERLDAKKMSMVVRVTVISPLKLGARACENHGLAVCRLMADLGGETELQPSKFNPKTEMFSAAVLVTFRGSVLQENWVAGGSCQVRFGSGYYLGNVVSFTAWQELKAEEELGNCVWYIRVEERLDGIRQESVPTSVGKISVMYENGREDYNDCKLTGRKRVFQDGAIHQIWDAEAQSRTLSNS